MLTIGDRVVQTRTVPRNTTLFRQGDEATANRTLAVTLTILTPHQIRRYAELRGYGSSGHAPPPEHAKP